ncbi:hypothetical protein MTO96_042132, partial [Rhipicephalus appendiculatus]
AFHDIQATRDAFHGTDTKETSFTLLGVQPQDAGTKVDEWTKLLPSLVTSYVGHGAGERSLEEHSIG